jgi:hypothetical protein
MLDNMKTVNSVKMAQSLFLLNAAIWLAFGIASLARMGSRPSAPVITLWIIAVTRQRYSSLTA